MLRRRARVIGSAAAFLAVFAIATSSSADLSPTERARRDVPLATVGSRVIHVGDLEDRLATMPMFQREAYGATPVEVRRGVLSRMLVRDALLASAAEGTLDDPLVHYEVARARSSATLRHLAKTVPEPPQIPQADVAAYYEAHKSTYQAPQRIHVWRILVATASDAEGVLGALRSSGTPETWGALCRERSLDQSTKLRRGSLGFLGPDGASSEAGVKAPPELYQAALTVSDGELVPKPLPEGDHFAVVWRRGSTPAKMQSLDAASPEIRRTLSDLAFKQAKTALLARLRAAHVSALDDALLGSFSLDTTTGIVNVHAPKNQP